MNKCCSPRRLTVKILNWAFLACVECSHLLFGKRKGLGSQFSVADQRWPLSSGAWIAAALWILFNSQAAKSFMERWPHLGAGVPRGFVIFIYYMKAFYNAREITQSMKELFGNMGTWAWDQAFKHKSSETWVLRTPALGRWNRRRIPGAPWPARPTSWASGQWETCNKSCGD